MNILITTSTDSPDGQFDPRFGRAAYFVLFDTESENWSAHANQAIHATGGAGVQASQFAINHKVNAVISGHFGPNAFMTLNAAGLDMYQAPSGQSLTANELLELFQHNKLHQVTQPSSSGHRH